MKETPVRPKDRKTALLDAAERAARTHGFDGFSYADMAKEVGIRTASIHYHFPSKADLSLALIDRYHAALEARCAEILQEQASAADRILALIALYREALAEGRMVCLCVSLTSSRESLSPEARDRIVAFRAMMVTWIASVLAVQDSSIAHVGDPVDEARAILALLEGAHLAARSVADVTAFDEATRVLSRRCGA